MPKGMTPKARMDERVRGLEKRLNTLRGEDLPEVESRLPKGEDHNILQRGAGLVDRKIRGLGRTMKQAQMRAVNRDEIEDVRSRMDKIHTNREDVAEYGSSAKDRAKSFREGGRVKKSFPDLNKDGEVTRADVLKGRGVEGFRDGGKVRGCNCGQQMSGKNFRGTF